MNYLSQADDLHLLDREILAADDVLCVPQMGIVSSSKDVTQKPFIFSSPMDTVTNCAVVDSMVENDQYAVVPRFGPENDLLKCIREYAGHPLVFFSVGLGKDKIHPALLSEDFEGTQFNVAVDIAHGDMKDCHDFTLWLSQQPWVGDIMSGSVCTPDAAERAWEHGCNFIRIGVGPGSACSTRIMTGCGYPQLSAVYQIRRRMEELTDEATLIADGGIRQPGDVVKYLSAGADAVMLGSVLSMAIEAPGWVISGWSELPQGEALTFPLPDPEPIYQKEYRGQASSSFQQAYGKNNDCPEGVSRIVDYQGDTVDSIIRKYVRGVSRGVSYLGLDSMVDLGPDTVSMVKITSAGLLESRPQG